MLNFKFHKILFTCSLVMVELVSGFAKGNNSDFMLASLDNEILFPLHVLNSYAVVRPPVLGDNPRALASGLSLVKEDKPLYNYFIPLSSV